MKPILLPYQHKDLEPSISEQTMRFHFDKHYTAYLNNMNQLIEGSALEKEDLCNIVKKSTGKLFNNAAQVWNHEFYFTQLMQPSKSEPQGLLLRSLENEFGSVKEFQTIFSNEALSFFGSGWIWLCKDGNGKLLLEKDANAGTPLQKETLLPLMCIDVWEHAYYLDYQNRRVDYINAFWKIINWSCIEKRFLSPTLLAREV